MDISAVLSQLISERDRLTEAISILERLAGVTGMKRRGRRPKWMAEAKPKGQAGADTATPTRSGKKRVISAESRKRMAEAQKKRWAAYHSTQG